MEYQSPQKPLVLQIGLRGNNAVRTSICVGAAEACEDTYAFVAGASKRFSEDAT